MNDRPIQTYVCRNEYTHNYLNVPYDSVPYDSCVKVGMKAHACQPTMTLFQTPGIYEPGGTARV